MKRILLVLALTVSMGLSVQAETAVTAQGSEPDALEQIRQAFVKAIGESCTANPEAVRRFVEYSDHGSANDVLLLQLYMSVHLPDDEVLRLIDEFDFGIGAWKDIDYASQDRGKWQSTLHLTRLYSLTKLYRSEESSWTGDPRIGSLIHSALAWWFANDPHNPNWWHNDIGVPRKIGCILLMMRDELSGDEIASGLNVLGRSKFGMTGQNKTWLALNNLIRGLIIDDLDLVVEARGYISEEIHLSDEEGIRDDNSFQQHGPQVQFGNYGLAYADGIALMLRVLAGTPYQFSFEQVKLFSDYFRDGLAWCVFKGVFDPNFCGRQNFIDAGRGKGCAFAAAAHNMAVAMEAEAAAYADGSTVADEGATFVGGDTTSEDGATFVGGDTAADDAGQRAGKATDSDEETERAAWYSSEAELYRTMANDLFEDTGENHLVGARYFPRSDCGIYRTSAWYSSVRMQSERTIGFEFTNRENTLGNFSADGAVLLLQDGSEYENIFACWDWRMVPGVTSYDDGRPIKSDDSREAKQNNTPHVGGAVAETSAGTVLGATMELYRDGLHALKSAFFFPDLIVELGADIRAENPDFLKVTTAVDQNRLVGQVSFNDSSVTSNLPAVGKENTADHEIPGEETADRKTTDGKTGKDFGPQTVVMGGKLHDNVLWVSHNGRGYVSLAGTGMKVSEAVQRGKWDYIDPAFHDKWDEMPVFKCWFDHSDVLGGDAGGYAYAILPCADAGQTEAFYKEVENGGAESLVLLNTADCQAVSHGDVVIAVLHKAGSYDLGLTAVQSDSPCILIRDLTADSEVIEPLPDLAE